MHRLGDVVRCPCAQRLHGGLDRSESGHHDERRFDAGGTAVAHQVDAVAVGHLDVAQGHIDVPAGT